MITSFHAKYFAYELTRQHAANDGGRLSQALFDALKQEMDESIRDRMNQTREQLLENFDEEVHERLRVQLNNTNAQLDRFSKRFWALSQFILAEKASFNDEALVFDLEQPPLETIPKGHYHLISKTRPSENQDKVAEKPVDYSGHLYRLSHPLGEFVIDQAKKLDGNGL